MGSRAGTGASRVISLWARAAAKPLSRSTPTKVASNNNPVSLTSSSSRWWPNVMPAEHDPQLLRLHSSPHAWHSNLDANAVQRNLLDLTANSCEVVPGQPVDATPLWAKCP